jgi:hypothetical protein
MKHLGDKKILFIITNLLWRGIVDLSQKDKRINEVTSAIKHEIRRTILTMLSKRSPMRYSDLMIELGLEPKDDSGSFGYHIKVLTDSGLIVATETGYTLSELGKRVFGMLTVIDNEDRDKFGIIASLQSLTIKDEINLLLAQFGMISSILFVFISLIGYTATDEAFSLRVVTILLSLIAMVFIGGASIKTFYSMQSKLPSGFSMLFFINTHWIWASPQRNKLFFCFLTYFGAFITFLLALLGVFGQISPEEAPPALPLFLISIIQVGLCGGMIRSLQK